MIGAMSKTSSFNPAQPRGKTTPGSNVTSFKPASHGKADEVQLPSANTEVDTWWDQAFLGADYDGNISPMIGDDNTPGRFDGRSIDGYRHTYRRWYHGDDMDVRLPSMAAIRRMSKQNPRKTFQIPVETVINGVSTRCWCSLTRGDRGRWGVEVQGGAGNPRVTGEAVRALLEARRPSKEPLETGRLLKAYRQRTLLEGTMPQPIANSEWMGEATWQDGVMGVRLGNKLYGYRVPKQMYEDMIRAESPGQYYNQHIKRKRTVTWVVECPRCHRYYLEKRGHTCPVEAKKPRGQTMPNRNAHAMFWAWALKDHRQSGRGPAGRQGWLPA